MSDNSFNAKERLFAFKKEFDPKLASFFDFKISQIKKIDPKTVSLVEQIKDLALRGGKRLRPAFLYYGFKCCGGKNEDLVWPYCLAIELLHSMALIHDDIMDNSDLRRGGLAVHKVLGVSGAIIAGDLCFSWAEELFGDGPRKYWDLLKEEVILGQYLDTNLVILNLIQNLYRFRIPIPFGTGPGTGRYPAGRGKSGMTMKPKSFNSFNFKELEQEVLKVLEYKTARYSVVRPLQIGACLAGAKKEELNVLENYGLPLGIAFQIVDDILGMFGDQKTVGKPVGSDLREGKITLLIIKTILKTKNQCRRKSRACSIETSAKPKTPQTRTSSIRGRQIKNKKIKEKRLLSLLGDRKASQGDLEWARGLIKETGALKYCQNKTQKLAEKAKRAVRNYAFEQKAKEFLLEIADLIIERKY